MPIAHIELWAGKNPEAKRNLARAVTDAMVEHIGCPAQAVTVIFEEVPKENWVIGGQPCSDLFRDVP